MNGTESERSTQARAFASALEKLSGVPVRLFDERLTSVQAERLMKNANMTRKERASFVDGVSSTILLQSFLDLQGSTIS
jgi:putative Holliday junction resolvase